MDYATPQRALTEGRSRALVGGDTFDLQNFLFGDGSAVNGVRAITSGANTVGAPVAVKDGAPGATLDLMNQFGVQYSTSTSAYRSRATGRRGPESCSSSGRRSGVETNFAQHGLRTVSRIWAVGRGTDVAPGRPPGWMNIITAA